MRGSGHFALGFLTGLVLFLALMPARGVRFRIYGPLLPFALGLWAALPYGLGLAGFPGLGRSPAGWLFFFYPGLHASPLLTRLLRPFWITTGALGLGYATIVAHYIGLIRSLRRAQ